MSAGLIGLDAPRDSVPDVALDQLLPRVQYQAPAVQFVQPCWNLCTGPQSAWRFVHGLVHVRTVLPDRPRTQRFSVSVCLKQPPQQA